MAAIRPNPTLPEDLISEILVRVPVKSLVRFQSVCKTWFSLIKHPAFVKSQLLRAITIETDQTFINCLDLENKFSLLNVDSRQTVAYPKFPYSRRHYKLIGSVNGIVCVAISVDYASYKDNIYLWNPAIRQYKLIPSYSLCHDIHEEALGFGYDQVDGDFKVVRVVMVGSPPSFRAEVYSANTNVWRKVPDPIDIPNHYFDVCLNGFLCGTRDYGMMAFDLNKEVLNCDIKLPVSYVSYEDVYDEIRIFELNKSIVVIVIMDDELNDDNKIKMWMLDDDACLRGDGVEASWTPVFSISLDRAVFSISLDWPAEIVNSFFSNGDLLVLIVDNNFRHMWISCNVDKKEANIVPFSVDMNEHLFRHHIYKYTESLVTVAGFKQVDAADVN